MSSTMLGALLVAVLGAAAVAFWMALRLRARSREISEQVAGIHAALEHSAGEAASIQRRSADLAEQLRTLVDAQTRMQTEVQSGRDEMVHRLGMLEAATAGERLAALEAYPLTEALARIGRLETELSELHHRFAVAQERLATFEEVQAGKRLRLLEKQAANERLRTLEAWRLDDRLRLLEGFYCNDRLLVLEELARVKKAASVVVAAVVRGDLSAEEAYPTLDELLALEEALLAEGAESDSQESD